jgi:hypothetical protein
MGGTFGIVFVWWPLTIYYDDNGTRVPAATSDVTLANDMQEYILSFSASDVPESAGHHRVVALIEFRYTFYS